MPQPQSPRPPDLDANRMAVSPDPMAGLWTDGPAPTPAPNGWTAGPAPRSTGWQPGPAPVGPRPPDLDAWGRPVFHQSDTSPNTIDPNTVGTALREFWKGANPALFGQLLPFPKALGGSGTDHPLALNPDRQYAPNFLVQMHDVKKEADALWEKGDHIGAATKYVESVIPILGPWMSQRGNEAQTGQWAKFGGNALALAAQVYQGRAVPEALHARYPLATHPMATAPPVAPAAVQFAQERGIPLDAATVSDNLAVKGTQAIADRSLGGSLIATPARARQAAAMTRVGSDLADETSALPTTAEQAGTSLRDALTAKMQQHAQAANVAYDRLRELEQNYLHADYVPAPAKESAEWLRNASRTTGDIPKPTELQELRRMLEEMRTFQYTGKTFTSTEGYTYAGRGNAGQFDITAGHEGARVVHDIIAAAEGSSASQADIQMAVNTALDSGRFTPLGRAALEVARQRVAGESGLERPELPPSAGDVAQKTQLMLMPVDLTQAKAALQPVYDQMKRQMPITQQQANPGLKALENIVTGPDAAPLSQVDRDLSAIKAVARERGGLAKIAVARLDAAVTKAASDAGPDVLGALKEGRAATVAKYAVSDVLDKLNVEPVRTINALTAPKDAAIQSLRAVLQHAPDQAEVIARAKLEDILGSTQKVADWRKLGAQTKAALFPREGQAAALDHFFELTDRISKTNVNPSGSGYVAVLGAQGAMLWTNPYLAVPVQIGAAALAKLLRSTAAVNALSRGLQLPSAAPAAVRVAATANLVRTAQSAGVVLDFPKAAESSTAPAPLAGRDQ